VTRWLPELVAVVCLAALVALTIAANANTATLDPDREHWRKHGCKRPVHGNQHRRVLRHVYRYTHRGGDYRAARVTRSDRHRLLRLRECAPTREGHYRRLRRVVARKRTWAFHQRIDRVTPFGEWAIPSYIVMCESGGNYRAWNQGGSDASGAYQFLGSSWRAWGGGRYASAAAHAAPWAQHLVAARYYRAAGTGPWECA
jgi:hypothetical protein